MDTLNIKSKTTLTLISIALSKAIKGKFKSANIDLRSVEASVDEKGKVNFSIDLSGDISIEDLVDLL